MSNPVLTIRILVTSNLPLDGLTEYSPDPNSGVFDKTTGVTTFETNERVGVIDLAGIVRRFSQALCINALSIKNNLGVHASGCKVSVLSPPRVGGAVGNSKTVVLLGNTKGIFPQANFSVPVEHRLVIDTTAEATNPGPYDIQITLSTFTGSKFLNRKVLQDPNVPGDAVLSWKLPVRAASTSNVDISSMDPGYVLDGVILEEGDSVLLKDQTNSAENGIYQVQGSGSPSVRRTDASNDSEVFSGMSVYVDQGTAQADTIFVLVTPDPIELNTTGLTITALSGGGASGEANTASSPAVTGASLFMGKVGVDLQFRTIRSSNGSLSVSPNVDTLDLAISEAGTANFNALSYTWPASPGASGQVLTNNGSGGLSWETPSAQAPVVNTFQDDSDLDITVGDVTAQTSLRVQLTLRIPVLGNASAVYTLTIVGNGVNALTTPTNIMISPGPTNITTVDVSVVLVGNLINLRLAGTGAGATVTATSQILSSHNV